MISNRIVTLTLTLTLGIATAAGIAALHPAYAGDTLMQLAQSAPAPGAAHHGPGKRDGRRDHDAERPRLFTPEERAQFEQKMRGAKTPEERDALRKEMQAAVAQRAREKGFTPGQRTDQQPDRPQLGQADHQRFQERWNSARTSEEREALRKEMLAAVDQRTEARNTRRATDGRPDGRQAGGPDGRRPDGPMARLVTPQEREQFREKVRNAKDRDARRKIMREMHAMVEARAKEKGITLPEHRRPMRGPRHEGGEPPRPQG